MGFHCIHQFIKLFIVLILCFTLMTSNTVTCYIGITGMLCSRFCRQILLTDHNEEVLKARYRFNLSARYVFGSSYHSL